MASPIELKIARKTYADDLLEVSLVHTYNPKPGNGMDDISESIPLVLEGSAATARTTINSINDLLQQARQRDENGYGDDIYLMTRTGGTAETWRRSRILDGRLSITDGGIIAGLASNDRTPATLTITREGYFEDDTLVAAAFYNSNGTMASDSPINLFNCNSGAGAAPNKLENYAILNSENIQGDLSSPVRFSLENGGTATVDKYFVSMFASGYGTAQPSYYFKDFSGTADAGCSGGSASVVSLSTAAETDMFTANVNGATNYRQFGGAAFHVVARFRNDTSLANVKFRLKFKSGTTTVWTGPQFLLPNTDIIQDLGVVNLPPGEKSAWSDGNLVITGQRTTGSTETIGLDFIQFFGGNFAQLDGLVPVAQNGIITYDGILKTITRYAGGGGNTTSDWIVYGSSGLMIQPGKSNIFMIAMQTSTAGIAPINTPTPIEAYYRPRWSLPL